MKLFVTAVLAFAVSGILTWVARRVAGRTGVVAHPTADRWHRTSVPLLGGLAIGITVCAVAAIALPLSRNAILLLLGSSCLLLVGLADDVRPLRPRTKIASQVLLAVLVAAAGLQLRLTGIPAVNFGLTVLWIVGIANAFNLLDNMDGLAAGIATITVVFRLVFYLMDGNAEGASLAAVFIGAVLGFVVYNFPPASIFMGDAGSLFLGFFVAGLSLTGGYPYSRNLVSVLVFPVLLMVVPILDTSFVTISRTLAGRPISLGGRDHISHRLVAIGLSERQAVLLLWVVALVSGAVATFSYRFGLSSGVILIALMAIGAAALGVRLSGVAVYGAETLPAALFRAANAISRGRQAIAIVVDVGLSAIAFETALLLRFEQDSAQHVGLFLRTLPVLITCQVLVFVTLRIHQMVWRYTSVRDVLRIAVAAAAGTLVAYMADQWLGGISARSHSIFVVDWLLLVGLVSVSRLSLRLFDELLSRTREGNWKVLIYGAGAGGALMVREMLSNAGLNRVAVGFLDDNVAKHRAELYGVPVLGGLDRLDEILATQHIDEVIVSTLAISTERIVHLRDVCRERGVAIRRVTLQLR